MTTLYDFIICKFGSFQAGHAVSAPIKHTWRNSLEIVAKCSQDSTCTVLTHMPMFDSFLTFWRRNYFFLISAHPVYKMWIIQEPNALELWNKLHFEQKKTESIYHA